MNRRFLFASFLTLFLASLAFNAWATGKPDVTSHEATFLGGAVNVHVEWQSPNPVIMVKIALANKEQELKVDPFDNTRNPFGYAGEVNVTVRLDSVPSQPFNYVVQLEDELRMKSALVTGKVKVSSVVAQPQQPGMQIQIQQGLSQPGFPSTQPSGLQPIPQPGLQPGAQPGGQQIGVITVIIFPQTVADGGGMWRVANGPWKKSKETMPNLPAGVHTIEYQDVANWLKPDNQQVMIQGSQTQTVNGIYFQK